MCTLKWDNFVFDTDHVGGFELLDCVSQEKMGRVKQIRLSCAGVKTIVDFTKERYTTLLKILTARCDCR